MNVIHVHGGVELQGSVRIQGSKNAALPILAATLLTNDDNLICNCPRIADVFEMLKLLKCLGCSVCWDRCGVRVNTAGVCLGQLPAEAVTGMRSSLFLMGALLGRSGAVAMEYPGGCVIGARPIDLHLEALSKMGAVFCEKEGKIFGIAPDGLHGAEITLRLPSVGATENIVLAAVNADGVTQLNGAAREPEIEHLCRYLQCCGALIEGIGTDCLRIMGGGRQLRGTCYTIPADRIVAGTYLLACVGTGGSVFLNEAPVSHMSAVIALARKMGAECQENAEGLFVQMQDIPSSIPCLVTRPYPDFPTDLQSVALAVMACAKGRCVIEETIFENRFRVVGPLCAMGADIRQIDASKVIVYGPARLNGNETEAFELRGGAALVIAGLLAEGETVIKGCRYIARGYENLCRDLQELGARIYSV